jgi:hypothetical protein
MRRPLLELQIDLFLDEGERLRVNTKASQLLLTDEEVRHLTEFLVERVAHRVAHREPRLLQRTGVVRTGQRGLVERFFAEVAPTEGES